MLGGYLAQFVWTRNNKIRGADPFEQILADIATLYNPEGWRSYADAAIFKAASTERKNRKLLRRGVDLVSAMRTFYDVTATFLLYQNL